MADSTEEDNKVQFLDALLPALISLIVGLVIHSFIIAVNVNDWWEGRSVTPTDHIITTLGISRVCTQIFNTLDVIMCMLNMSDMDLQITAVIIDVVYAFFTFANGWLTSLLSIVTCLKISNFHTRLLLYLRRMIVQRTVYFITASVLLSAFNSLMPLLNTIIQDTKAEAYNATMELLFDCPDINYLSNILIGASIPLLFFYISSILLFSSLYYHTTRMKKSSNLTINLETYYSVMRFVSFTFIYNTMYLLGHFVSVSYYYLYCLDFGWLYIVLDFLPVLHSSYLIYKTAKLRNQMSKFVQKVIDFLFQMKHGN